MSISDRTGHDWATNEIDLIVADYFDMLRMEITGIPYVKAHRNAALQELTGRSKGSIEFKHQNISAILLKLGRPRIEGYKPKANFQIALLDGIERHLFRHGEVTLFPMAEVQEGFSEEAQLLFEPPPDKTDTDFTEPEILKRLIRKFDPAKRDARNRALGKRGEELIFFSEQARLRSVGKEDLANRVRWVSEVDGDGAGYDIHSFSNLGEERLLEVKTTTGHQTTPFYISENERLLSVERPDEFRLVRLYDFVKEPRAFKLNPPLDKYVELTAMNYRASFVR